MPQACIIEGCGQSARFLVTDYEGTGTIAACEAHGAPILLGHLVDLLESMGTDLPTFLAEITGGEPPSENGSVVFDVEDTKSDPDDDEDTDEDEIEEEVAAQAAADTG